MVGNLCKPIIWNISYDATNLKGMVNFYVPTWFIFTDPVIYYKTLLMNDKINTFNVYIRMWGHCLSTLCWSSPSPRDPWTMAIRWMMLTIVSTRVHNIMNIINSSIGITLSLGMHQSFASAGVLQAFQR